MAGFNPQPMSVGETFRAREDATVNHEGGLAFAMDPRSRLFTRVLSSFCGEPKYYESGADDLAGLRADVRAVAEVAPEFVLRLAAFARQECFMRSTSVAVLAEAAAIPACKPFVRRWTPQIVRRADELAEVVAAWIAVHGQIGTRGATGGEHAFPNSLSQGLADAMRNFDEYQLSKYDRERSVTLRDVLRIVRPKPENDAQAALWKYLVRGELDIELLPILAAKAAFLRKDAFDAEAVELTRRAHLTWEVATSKFGAKAEVWNALQLPFMAGLRNIANCMRTGADDALTRICAMLRDARAVERSRQLPFRFLSAYRMIESGMRPQRDRASGYVTWVPDPEVANHPRRSEVLEAVAGALELSVVNLPRLGGVTFVTSDNSASMDDHLSDKTTVSRKDVANLLAGIAHRMCERAIVSVFGDSHAVVPVVRTDSILANVARLTGTDVGHSTNAYLAIRHLREQRIPVSRIVCFSDMQCYSTHHGWGRESLVEELTRYRREVAPEVCLYSVDLAGYGTAQFPSDDPRVALLAGWSEKLLGFIPLFERDGAGAVDRIAAWTPQGVLADEVSADESAVE